MPPAAFGITLALAAGLLAAFGGITTAHAVPSEAPMATTLCRKASDCRTLGLQHFQAGNFVDAFNYLKIACENHPPQGALFTCAIYFTVARELSRLDEAHARLEKRCASGDSLLCYHLARAYLAVDLPAEAARLLDPLCGSDFRLPFKAAFGPCHDWGTSLKAMGDIEGARRAFGLDCKRGGTSGRLSCASLDQLERALTGPKPRKEPMQLGLLGLLALPFLAALLLVIGGRAKLRLVKWGLPPLTLALWGAWEAWVFGIYDIRLDLVLILPAAAGVFLMAYLAHRKLRRSAR